MHTYGNPTPCGGVNPIAVHARFGQLSGQNAPREIVGAMLRPVVRLAAFLSTFTCGLVVRAHDEPPAAYTVLSHDAQGARAVRLNLGVALRRAPQRFQFVCPAAWGDQYPAPLSALADGTIVVGATRGLKLLSEDGSLRVHPDPTAIGDSSEVVSSARGVFVLRATTEGSELLAVDAQRVRVLWKDAQSLYSLAALDDKLLLLRANGTTIEQVTIAASDGAELERQVAALGAPVDYVYARAAGGTAYALIMFRTSSALGRLQMNTFNKIAEAELTIAGPLGVGGDTLLALDGKLSQLIDGAARPLAESKEVLCLEQHAGLAYACNRDGIAALSGPALGAPLFQFSWLLPPDLEQLPAGKPRDDCNLQWQDLRVDLLEVGIAIADDAPQDAGSAVGVPEGGANDAGGVEAHDAGTADGGQTATPGSVKRNPGCQSWPGASAPLFANVLILALALLTRLRRHSFRASGHKSRARADF